MCNDDAFFPPWFRTAIVLIPPPQKNSTPNSTLPPIPRHPIASSDEDHTLGNALRHVLMQNKEVDFCGYSVPHPSEPKMNLRLQTTGKT